MFKYFSVFVLLLAVLISCQKPMKSGIDKSMMDTSVKPTEDFYQYANGSWLKEYEIPADRSNYGIFAKLRDEAEKNLKIIIEESADAKSKPEGSNVQKIGDMYLSFMDSAQAEELGIGPIKDRLAAIEKIKDKKELVKYIAQVEKIRINNPFAPYIFADQPKNLHVTLNYPVKEAIESVYF